MGAGGRTRGQIVSASDERALLQQELGGPRFVYVAVEILPVEPCDVDGYIDPITGDSGVRCLEVVPDFSMLIDRETMRRYNAWTSPEHAEKVGRFAALAVPPEQCDPGSLVVEVRLRLKCPASRVHVLLDDASEVVYLSGGWRSGKTFLMLQKWLRAVLRNGGPGRRAWLVGPEKKNAWRMVETLFRGRQGTPALAPTMGLDKYKRPRSLLVADRLARNHRANDLEFHLLDGTACEPFHTRGGAGHLEGEAAFVIAYDEARLDHESDPFDIMRGRVMADQGQVIVASVPDDGAPWLYEKVVAEAERQKHWEVPATRMHTLDAFGNPYVPDEAVKRAMKNESDPIVRDQKFLGIWTMRGAYAYSDVYDDLKHERDHLSHDAEAWGVGDDITTHVQRSTCKRTGGSYIVGVDFNWEPQTRLVCKVFGQQGKPETWTLVCLDEVVTLKCDAKQAAKELAKRKRGKYRNSVVVADCNGFHSAHRYGGRESANHDSYYYAEAKFRPVAPIHTRRDGGGTKTKHSNPQIGESRTLVRELMREGRLFINAGGCPRLVNAIRKAPNRRKRKADAGTWLDREVYNLEDCLRYVAWRVFSPSMTRTKRRPVVDGVEIGAPAP